MNVVRETASVVSIFSGSVHGNITEVGMGITIYTST